jgi:CheY-like chemotaxis protein
MAILIVEDDRSTAELLQRLLARRNIDPSRIVAVSDAESALDYLKDRSPSCIIADDILPGMSGLELLKLIKADPRHANTCVFIYSASLDWERTQQAKALGVDHWYTKGVSRLNDLIQSAAAACGAD